MILHYFNLLISYLSKHIWPAVLWTLLILLLCLMPSSDLPDSPVIPGFDKIVHIGLFAVWSFLWTSFYHEKTPVILFLGILLGISIEYLQEIMAMGRSFEWWDLAADTLGVFAGYVVRIGIIPKFRVEKK